MYGGELNSATRKPSRDSFHSFHDNRVIADGIHGSVYLDLKDNRRSHSAEVAQQVERFVMDIRGLND